VKLRPLGYGSGISRVPKPHFNPYVNRTDFSRFRWRKAFLIAILCLGTNMLAGSK
jgi:hypothetical protein